MRPISSTNSELISRVFTETRNDVYGVFRQACIPEDQCWDMTQDVFVKLMVIDLLDADRIKGMVFTIAYRMRTDYFRHRSFINKLFSEKPDVSNVDWMYNVNTLEVKDIERVELGVVSRMSETDRKVYCMDRFDEKSSTEIAQELHITCRAVENRLYRTRKLVREKVRKAVNF